LERFIYLINLAELLLYCLFQISAITKLIIFKLLNIAFTKHISYLLIKKQGEKMKNFARLSLVLSVLFLIVTANESNAAMQSQQENASSSFNHDYLPDYTVNTNTLDSEEPVLLAKRWGHYNRTHVCLDRINKYRPRTRYTYKSRWCKNMRARKARKARKHYRKLMVRYHKRKARLKRKPICKIRKALLSPVGSGIRKGRCFLMHPAGRTAMAAAAKAKMEQRRAEQAMKRHNTNFQRAQKNAQMAKQRAQKRAAEIKRRAAERAKRTSAQIVNGAQRAKKRAETYKNLAQKRLQRAKSAAARKAKTAAYWRKKAAI